MPDTKKNQAEYPQHSNQKPGCGFPIIKLVVMFSLSTAGDDDTCQKQFAHVFPIMLLGQKQ